jgi:hypothetical protein
MQNLALAHSPKTEYILRSGLGFNTSVETLDVARVSDLPPQELAKALIDESGLLHTDRILFLNRKDSSKLEEQSKSAQYDIETNIAILRNKYNSEDVIHEIAHGNGFMVGQFSYKNPDFFYQTGYDKYFYILENLIGISKVCLQNGIYLNGRQQVLAEKIKDIQEIFRLEDYFYSSCNPTNLDLVIEKEDKDQPSKNQVLLRARAELIIKNAVTRTCRTFITELEAELITAFLSQPKQNLLPFATKIYKASGGKIDPLRFCGTWYKMVLEANGFGLETDAQIEERRKNIRRLFAEG